jgi:GGDEF domain-containing protein
MAKRYIQAQLAKLFSEELRDSDLIALQSNEYVIILPEVEAEEAEKQVGRLTDLAAQRLGVKLSIGMADFPAKGITLNGLINAASRNLLDVSQTVGENSQGQQGIVTSSTPGSAGI